MAAHEHRGKPGAYERERGDERAWREPREAAHAMAARATGRVAGADADEQSGHDERAEAGVDLRRLGDGEQRVNGRRGEKAQHERSTPQDIALHRVHESTDDSADPRDAAV